MEQWRDVPGYEGLYQISDFGRVRSIERSVLERGGRVHKVPGRTTNGSRDHYGYLTFGLCKDGKRRTVKVHRLVAEVFMPNPDGLPQVNHKNGCKADNRVANLEWCTLCENMAHAGAHGLSNVSKAVKASAEARRRQIVRSDGVRFDDAGSAAEAAGVTRGAIVAVLRGRNKTAGGFSYTYKV